MVLLDGKEIESVDPAKCRFIGTFRKPFEQLLPQFIPYEYHECACGRRLGLSARGGKAPHESDYEDFYEHWMRGHFDMMQYVTI